MSTRCKCGTIIVEHGLPNESKSWFHMSKVAKDHKAVPANG